jgi:anti-sigma factor RsiW
MTRCARSEEIEDLALGLLPPVRASRMIAHAAVCPSCAAELSLVQHQRELFVRRARTAPMMRPDLGDVFARIEVRRNDVRRSWRQASATLAAVLAAAATFVVAWSGGSQLPWALLAPSHDALEAAVQASRTDPEPPRPCEPMTCSEDSVLLCEPVTCAEPALVAQSQPAACNEHPWTSFDRCVSQVSAETATP